VKPILELKDISIDLSGRRIVSNVSLRVAQGDILGIIGPNGGGKSTLLKAILKLLPYRGQITRAPGLRVGYVPQYFDFDRTLPLTVRELFALRVGGFPFGGASEAVRRQLSAVGADQLLHKRLGVLSGGELQRVLIALALVGDPQLVVLDEPSSSLDVAGERELFQLITRLARERRLTVLFVSHDLDALHEYATTAICLNRELVCQGPPRTVLTPEVVQRAHAAAPHVHHRG
jgi:zinc transport system ATP-binding protein